MPVEVVMLSKLLLKLGKLRKCCNKCKSGCCKSLSWPGCHCQWPSFSSCSYKCSSWLSCRFKGPSSNTSNTSCYSWKCTRNSAVESMLLRLSLYLISCSYWCILEAPQKNSKRQIKEGYVLLLIL